MSWQKEVDEIAKRRELAEQLGGEERVARHRSQGKLTARERVDAILDEGSFREAGILTGKVDYDADGQLTDFTPSNIVGGTGRIDDRRVCVAAEDFTVRGGSSESTNPEKWMFLERLAMEMRIPMVRLVDMAGGSVKLLDQAGATKPPGYPHLDQHDVLGLIPIAAAALGPVAGMGAVRVIGSHFSVMVKETSQLFAGGPPVVERGTGEKLTKEELGGYRIHARGSGAVDNEAEDEHDAFDQIRRFLSYLPQSCFQLPPRTSPDDSPDRREEELLSIIPKDKKKPYKCRKILDAVFDRDSIFEIGRYNGRSIVTCFARLHGYPVGAMINDPYQLAGALDADASEKVIRFVDLCDSFHLPIVNMVDQPGVAIGLAAEKAGTIRKAMRALAAISQTQVPFVAVFIRRAFGVAGSGYGRQHDLNLRYAWPSGYWGSIPIEGGVAAAYRRELEAAEDPDARLEELEKHYQNLVSPFRTAERFGVTDIIDPRDTRPLLCDWVEMAYDVLPEQLGMVRRSMRL
jgi:acetyl-CoA carboxylase carboxyltransferase component